MKTVLITGANRGIGLGLAKHYLNASWVVVGSSRVGREAEAFQTLGDSFVPVQLDVSDEQSIHKLRDTLSTLSFDLVVNNAGTCFDESMGEWTSTTFVESFKVNSIGPALVAQTVAPLMNEGAKLVNITSGMGSLELGINPENGLDAYAMSKAALNMLSRRLAEKFRPAGTIVVSLNPGWVQTDMGGAGAPNQVGGAVAAMASVIDGLTLEQSGLCLAETGSVLPW